MKFVQISKSAPKSAAPLLGASSRSLEVGVALPEVHVLARELLDLPLLICDLGGHRVHPRSKLPIFFDLANSHPSVSSRSSFVAISLSFFVAISLLLLFIENRKLAVPRVRRRMKNELNFSPNFERLVLGCIYADFCN